MRRAACLVLFLAVLIAADYFLFHGYELVFPFFLLPYVVMAGCYTVFIIKKRVLPIGSRMSENRDPETDGADTAGMGDTFIHVIYLTVIIPVFSGLVMSIAWMFKIHFFREVIGGLFR